MMFFLEAAMIGVILSFLKLKGKLLIGWGWIVLIALAPLLVILAGMMPLLLLWVMSEGA